MVSLVNKYTNFFIETAQPVWGNYHSDLKSFKLI